MNNKILILVSTLISSHAFTQNYDFDALDTDKQMAKLAEENPGFGGFYTDSEGRAVLLVTKEGNKAQLAAEFTPEDGKTEVLTEDVKYNFSRLYEYKVLIRDILSEPGVIYVDLDEKQNKIVVAVDQDKNNRSALISDGELSNKDVAQLYDIPEDALKIIETQPVVDYANLRSKIRPAPGGMQITKNTGGSCTMGLVVKVGSINGFITNSHCTNTKGGVEGTRFYQPTISSGNLIGTEVRDPQYVSGGACPTGRRCRSSDSALIQFTGNNMGLGHWGYMAAPPCSDCNNYITISPTRPRFDMVYNNRNFAVGDRVQKVGRTTGWTKGTVTNTCVDINASGNTTLLCQASASLGATYGDSGSLVMKGSYRYRRKMTGLMWGGIPGTRTTYFSSRDQVESDIGVVDYWP